MEPARIESCPSGRRRDPAAPGEDKFHPWTTNHSIYQLIQQHGDENGDAPGRYRPARCGNLNLTG